MTQVLALKYRPSTFDKLIGQESVVQTLSLALSGERLSHAYLFSGLRGSGKTSTARIFAKALVCENGPTATRCESCVHCLSANENRHIDIIEMDAASNRGIDDIRELIESTKYKPNMARFKVFIIDEVHMLTTQAFNALLKTLEEPPNYVKFILATTDPLKLPATILSRTQHFRFKQIKNSDVLNHLCHILHLENIEYEKEALEMLARAGSGSLRDTLTLMDQAIIYSKGYITPNAVATMLGLLDSTQLERIFSAILGSHRQELLALIKELESYECEVVIDELIVYLKNAFFEQDRRFSTLLYERFFKILSEAKSLLHINADNGFILALVFFKMIEATSIKSIEEMIDSLEGEKFHTFEASPTLKAPSPESTIPQEPLENKVVQPIVNTPNYREFFEKLCLKLDDRNAQLGDCFRTNITFLSFEENTLQRSSKAQDDASLFLKHNSALIKHFVQEIFGLETKINIIKEEVPPHVEASNTHANEESSSMIESVEFEEQPQSESCAVGNIMAKEREIDVKEILSNPFIQRAQELFEAKKIEIHAKV